MSDKLIYYSNVPFLHRNADILDQIPGGHNFLKMAKFFQPNVGITDRTGTFIIPFKVENLDPLPEYDPAFSLSYKDCAMARMTELEQLHNTTGKRFRLLYSGGVDSTAIFASFIEYFGLSKTSQILEICCSRDSIDENPWVWERYIRPGNFKLKTSHDHTNGWNDNVIVLMGEGNDQLFNNSTFSQYRMEKNLYDPVTFEGVVDYLSKGKPNPDAEYCASKLIELANNAPIPIENMCMFHWWFPFILSWNAVTHRVLSQANQRSFPTGFLADSFQQFFKTDKLQQWSMKFHNDNPESFGKVDDYKLECKTMSIEILNIPEYASKHKFRSFPTVHSMRPAGCLIDNELNIGYTASEFLKFIEPTNSFVGS